MSEGMGRYELSNAGERVVGKNNYCPKFKLKKKKPGWHRWAQTGEVTLHRWLDCELSDHLFICTLSPWGQKCDMRRLFTFQLLMSVFFFFFAFVNQHQQSVSSAGVAQRSGNAENVWNYTYCWGKMSSSEQALEKFELPTDVTDFKFCRA